MQADFSLEDQATFQQVLPLQQFMTGRRAKREKEGGKKAPSREREGGVGGNKGPSREREGSVGGKKTPTKFESESTSMTPLSSKLLHEKVHVYCE